MGVFGASRFTALLAAVAISGMAGTFWWALETRSDMKAAVGNNGPSRALPPKLTGRVSRSKDDRPGKFESNKFELMGRSSERPQSGPPPGAPGQSGDQDQSDRLTPQPLLANYPNPGPPNPGPPNPGPQSRSLQSLNSQNQSAQSPGSLDLSPPSSRGDMPLPALPAMAPIAPAQPEPAPWHARAPDPPAFLPQLPATPAPAETPRRPVREARPGSPVTSAAARAPKPSTQPSYYMEKFVEQGEYRYRRRACEPPNMPDVCFMPQADRQPIVVAKP
jgi:hypothetical protein